MRIMAITALGYIGIAARDLRAWQAFAESILGAQVDTHEDCLKIRVDERAWRILIEQGDADDLSFMGWETASEVGFSETITGLVALNVATQFRPDLAQRRGVKELVQFVDPAGIECELYWGATTRLEKPFISPTGVSGFVTGNQGLGHAVVAVADPAGYEAFYKRLGFAVSDYIDMAMGPDMVLPICFMHCNSRHHTLAFAPAPSPKKLLHLMLQTRTMDDVGLVHDRALKADVPISMSLGRHSNDLMFSFYMVTPSGFEFEYGWGARVIDEDWNVTRHDVTSVWGHKMLIIPGGATHD
jgi:biphenyl-2,3-diol 1,2-dioxygenase